MDLELTLDAREAQGKANKRLRRAGIVPGIVFGKGEASTHVQVDAKVFDTLYRAAGRTSVVKLRLPGASTSTSGFIKSVQRNPLSGSRSMSTISSSASSRDGGRGPARVHR